MSKLLQIYKQKNEKINSLYEKTDLRIGKYNHFFDNNLYFPMEELDKMFNDFVYDIQEYSQINLVLPFIYKNHRNLRKNIKLIQRQLKLKSEHTKRIRIHNEKIATINIEKIEEILGDVENKKLDNQQLQCLAKESNSHLVIAGAGTGKTLTMIGYAKYLLNSKKAKPEDILVLSFTDDSATEINNRLSKETGCKIDALTFHKLGLNIISGANGKKAKLTNVQNDFQHYISDNVRTLMSKDRKYFYKVQKYTTNKYNETESEFSFDNLEEYNQYIKENPPRTMKGELVKSYSEVDVANFLFINGIEYEYEKSYCIDTATEEYSQYSPDFYLPEYDIYIEMFGINEDGEVPNWFKTKEGLTPTQTYQQGIEWKRKTHKQYNTKLIECYSYEKFNGTLEENLFDKLSQHSVVFTPVSQTDIINQINDLYSIDIISYLANEIGRVIGLLKGKNQTIEQLRNNNKKVFNRPKTRSKRYINELLIDIIEPIYNIYQNKLTTDNEIDFNDMINLATKYVVENKFIHKYKYVIIDEYQDISFIRYNLIKALRNQNDFKLMCVGDDWQSIYQFSGSDIGYITNFEKYWGLSDISKIETTYRFQKNIIQKAHDFVMENPHQIDKNIKSKNTQNDAIFKGVSCFNTKEKISAIESILDNVPEDSSVFLLGRYKKDIDFLRESKNFSFRISQTSTTIIKYKNKKLKIEFMTVHKSKGLEADYVIILNNNDDAYGFPSKIKNPPIYDLLLESSDNFLYAEERRLFYVAITRTKKDVFLICDKEHKSSFFKELSIKYRNEFSNEKVCPMCGANMKLIKGKYGLFWGCENFFKTNCRYKEKYQE